MNLEDKFFPSAAKLQRLYRKYFCEAVAEYRLTPNEISVLVHLLQNGERLDTATDIAQERGISKALVTRSVSSLASRGFVRTERDGHDRRIVHLHLSEKSREIACRLEKNRLLVTERLQYGIAPEDLECVSRVMDAMQRNLDDLLENDERMKNI
ncbi:MAG: MarR family winged helix-turn-helix transcriptional regulator [Eubacteriales bacterium]|nr:MarR family winged helix-turn-helix transcriptional regulator [Eubacteriales bacterium]